MNNFHKTYNIGYIEYKILYAPCNNDLTLFNLQTSHAKALILPKQCNIWNNGSEERFFAIFAG